jgi:hypothetical protein
MSLGWQTESALLPSRAKRIQVADKSMVGLRSVVLQQEQQRDLRRSTDASLAKQRQLRGFSAKLMDTADRAQSQPDDDKKRKRNDSDDDVDGGDRRAEKARRALEAKAKLYDALRDRQTAPVDDEANALAACAAAGALVDFDGAARCSDAARTNSPPPEGAPVLCSARAEGRAVAGPPQFRWSTGRPASEPAARGAAADDPTRSFLEARRSEQTLRHLADSVMRQNSDRDDAAAEATGPTTGGGVSQGARVKSQWERQLGDDAKLLAQAVHRETEQLRSAASASLDAAPTSAHEERLRLLQQKRERLQAQHARRRGES